MACRDASSARRRALALAAALAASLLLAAAHMPAVAAQCTVSGLPGQVQDGGFVGPEDCRTEDIYDCFNNVAGDSPALCPSAGDCLIPADPTFNCVAGSRWAVGAPEPGCSCIVEGAQVFLFGTPYDPEIDAACPVPTTGACGDPHLFGYDGSDFDVQGVPGGCYNLFSDASHTINACMVARGQHYDKHRGVWHQLPTHGNTSTWIGSVGVVHGSDELVVAKGEDGAVTVTANGEAVSMGQTVALRSGAVVSYFNKTYPAGQERVRFADEDEYTTPHVLVTTPTFVVAMDVLPSFSRRMDVNFGLRAPLAQLDGTMAGLLGRTVRTQRGQAMEAAYPDTTFVIDEHSDEKLRFSQALEDEVDAVFRVASATAHKFPGSRFDGSAHPAADVGPAFVVLNDGGVSRRRLSEQAPLAAAVGGFKA